MIDLLVCLNHIHRLIRVSVTQCLRCSADCDLTQFTHVGQLLEEIWGYDFDGETRTVDVHIRTLRQKLGTAGDMIETVRGVGYRISE